MNRLFKHKLLIGGVALVLAGSAGGAYAATQSGTNSRQAFLNDVAKRLNVTPSALDAAVKGALLDRLQAAVNAGQITQAQANRIEQRIEQGGPVPLGGGVFWRHIGGRGVRERGLLPAAASYLGVSMPQLVSDLRSGKSLAQVAQAQNKSVSGLEQALVQAATARLDRLVSSGRLTQAQEQRRLSRLSTRIDRLVNAHPRFTRPAKGYPPPAQPFAPSGAPSPSYGAPLQPSVPSGA